MARTENRTEIHRKFAEQIQAIESVARENQRVADVLEQRVANIPDHVIALVENLKSLCQMSPITPVSDINYDTLTMEPGVEMALIDIGFSETKLKALYCVICDAPDCFSPEE